MTALFVAIFVEQWEQTRDHRSAIAGLLISVMCRMAFGADRFLIPAMLGITAALLLFGAKSGVKEAKQNG